MTLFNGKSDSIPPKDKQYLDLVLEGKPDRFKVRVYEIVRKFKLDASDAAFLLLIATGRLEVLLHEFPDQFEALLRQELGLLQQECRKLKQQLDAQLDKLKTQVGDIRATGDSLVNSLSNEVKALVDFAETHQVQTKAEIAFVLKLSREERVAREQEWNKKLETAQYEHLVAVRGEAEKLIEIAGEKLRGKYLRQLTTSVTIGALVLFSLGGIAGWTGHRLAMGELDPAGPRQLSLKQWQKLQWAVSSEGQLAKDLIDWNRPNLYECLSHQGMGGGKLQLALSDGRPITFGNCSLWIVPPEKREFGPKPPDS